MDIIWKSVLGFEGYYEVSSAGEVRSLNRVIIDKNNKTKRIKGCLMNIHKDKAGYCTVNFHVKGKSITKLVHRIVALSFLGYSELQVDHIDENKSNNQLDNLQYLTSQQNIIRSIKSRKRNKTSKYHYVYFKKRIGKWAVIEPITNKQLGYYKTEEDAYIAFKENENLKKN
jgi:hypothetical protein